MTARVLFLHAAPQVQRLRAGAAPAAPAEPAHWDERTAALVRAAHQSGLEAGERLGFAAGVAWRRWVCLGWGALLGAGAAHLLPLAWTPLMVWMTGHA